MIKTTVFFFIAVSQAAPPAFSSRKVGINIFNNKPFDVLDFSTAPDLGHNHGDIWARHVQVWLGLRKSVDDLDKNETIRKLTFQQCN